MPPDDPGAGDVAEMLQQAIQLHRSGDLSGAEELYRSILARHARHPDANHNIGLLLMGAGSPALALPHLQAALQANPSQGRYWLSCIDALMQASQIDAARQMLDVGVQHGLRGDAVEALQRRLGQLATANADPLAATGVEPAQASGEQTNVRADEAAKGGAGAQSGRRVPRQKERARLQTLLDQERDADLEKAALSWSARYPHSGFAWNLLGVARQRRRRFAEAETFYRRAFDAEPELAEACFNLGRMLQLRGATADAEVFFRRAIAAHSQFPEAHCSLGEVLGQLRRFAEAEDAYRRALEIQPKRAVIHNNLAVVLRHQDRPGDAEFSARQALALDPQLAEAWCTLGAALQDEGRLGEASDGYRRALALQPDLPVAWHGLLFCLSHSGVAEPSALFAEHVRFAERFETPLRAAWPHHRNTRDPDRVLQVGFVSGDFRQHALANFIEPMLASLARVSELELHAYSSHAVEDAVTRRIRSSIRHWNSIFALSDEALARKIQADGIDILVDLTGHTAHNRLLTFARKPAPVQCGWIGYLGTSGLAGIDYYLADRYFLPPGEFDSIFTEKIVYLSAVAPFQPSAGACEVNPLPALQNGYVTFGSFSRIAKLNPSVIALWSQLLRALPEARMLVAGMPSDGGHSIVSRWFEEEGVPAERLEFHPRCDTAHYFALHHRVDLCLDPFPFTGATTTGNALWMGVPTLTLAGQTVPGRLGAALLCHAGLEEFVARRPADFVEKGIVWGRNPERLAPLRDGMRDRFLGCLLGKPALVAQSLAEHLRSMWRTWCEKGS